MLSLSLDPSVSTHLRLSHCAVTAFTSSFLDRGTSNFASLEIFLPMKSLACKCVPRDVHSLSLSTACRTPQLPRHVKGGEGVETRIESDYDSHCDRSSGDKGEDHVKELEPDGCTQ